MKRLFFLLCLLNLSFLLWQFRIGNLTSEKPREVAPSSIFLVGEYERARRGAHISGFIDNTIRQWRQTELENMLAELRGESWQLQLTPVPVATKPSKPLEPEKIVEPVKPPLKVVERKCYEVGPFDGELGAKKWLAEKSLIGKQILQKDFAIPYDYQVYYPAAKTPEQSRINKMMLNAKGLQDIWMIPDGDLKGGYSLGVFREKQRALNFRSQLAEKGIQAEIKLRDKTRVEWFVRVMLDKSKLKQYESPSAKVAACAPN